MYAILNVMLKNVSMTVEIVNILVANVKKIY